MSQMLDRQVYLNIDSQNFVTTDIDGAQSEGREGQEGEDENRLTEKNKKMKHRLSYMKLD
jgi:hypothetical protein